VCFAPPNRHKPNKERLKNLLIALPFCSLIPGIVMWYFEIFRSCLNMLFFTIGFILLIAFLVNFGPKIAKKVKAFIQKKKTMQRKIK